MTDEQSETILKMLASIDGKLTRLLGLNERPLYIGELPHSRMMPGAAGAFQGEKWPPPPKLEEGQ